MIIFFYGQDSFRAKQKIKELKDKFLTEVDASGASVTSFNGVDLTIEKFHEQALAGSLFARKRLLIVENLFGHEDKDFLNEFFAYLKNKFAASDNALIIYEPLLLTGKKGQAVLLDGAAKERALNKEQQTLFAHLKAAPFCQYFPLPSEAEAGAWIKRKLAAADLKIDYKAGQLLVGLLGNDLWALNNELDKLINYKLALGGAAAATLTVAEVEENIRGQLDQGVFALTDAIGNKNKAQAVRLLRQQLAIGVNEVYLLTMLVRQFRILLAVRQALDNGQAPAKVKQLAKLHPYVLQKGINQARNFNLTALKNIFSALTKLDYNFKTGKLNVETMLDLLVAKI